METISWKEIEASLSEEMKADRTLKWEAERVTGARVGRPMSMSDGEFRECLHASIKAGKLDPMIKLRPFNPEVWID